MGTFVVRKSGKTGFKIAEIVEWKDGKPKTKAVPKLAWQQLGFREEQSLDEAREVASTLNKMHAQERKAASAARNVEATLLADSIYLPASTANVFLKWLTDEHIQGRESKKKFLSHWQAAQALILHIKQLPPNFYRYKNQMLRYLQDKKYSVSYVKKILQVLNLWGEFYCTAHHMPYPPVIRLDKTLLQEITETYEESDDYRGPCPPLTPEHLERKRAKLTDANYKWLFASVWLGLRPIEINKRHAKARRFSVEADKALGVPVLKIYQWKLKRYGDKAWKSIPLFLPEMLKAVAYLDDETIKAPTYKRMKAVFADITLYGGRKNFMDLMLSRNQTLEDISGWMGHQSVEMTWSKYRNKKRTSFTA